MTMPAPPDHSRERYAVKVDDGELVGCEPHLEIAVRAGYASGRIRDENVRVEPTREPCPVCIYLEANRDRVAAMTRSN